jgi:hypothetical protein
MNTAVERENSVIRGLNDHLRCRGAGGSVCITRGLAALGPMAVVQVRQAVARFDGFNEDNDPWGEHDCAVLAVGSHRVIFKIDYYDATLTRASEEPADACLTHRVLTIMLAEEY